MFMQINYLPARGAVGARDIREPGEFPERSGFPGNAVHKAELSSQMLLYQTLYA